jgi:hypothetical protein
LRTRRISSPIPGTRQAKPSAVLWSYGGFEF